MSLACSSAEVAVISTSTVDGLSARRQFVLVTTDDCHFCKHAHTVLAGLDVGVREVDIASEEAQALAEQGIPLAFLPVLTDGARVIAYGRFSEKRLRRELAR